MTFNSSVQAAIVSDNLKPQSFSNMSNDTQPTTQIPLQNPLNMTDLNSEDPGLSSSTTASSSASETSNSPTPTPSAPTVNVWKIRLEAQQEKQAKVKATEANTEQKQLQKPRETRDERTKKNGDKDKQRKEEEDKDALDGFVKVIAKNTRGKKNTLQRQTSLPSIKSSTILTSVSSNGILNNNELRKKEEKLTVQKATLASSATLTQQTKTSTTSAHPQQNSQQHNLQQRTPASPSTSSQLTADQNITNSESKTASPTESVTDSGAEVLIEKATLDLKPTYTPAKIVVTHARSENVSRPESKTTLQIDNSVLWPSLGTEPPKPPTRTVTPQANGSQNSRSLDSSNAEIPLPSTKKNKTFIPFDITPEPTTASTFSGSIRGGRGRGGRGRGRSNNAALRAQRASFSGTSTMEPAQLPIQPQQFTQHRHSEGHILSPVSFTTFVPASQTPVVTNVTYTAYPNLGIDTAFITPENADLDTVRIWLRQQIEYYFSIENLCRDLYFRKHMSPETGAISLSVITNFPRVRNLLSLAKSKYLFPERPSVIQSPIDTDQTLDDAQEIATTQVVALPPTRDLDVEVPLWAVELALTALATSEVVTFMPTHLPPKSIEDLYIRKRQGWEYWVIGGQGLVYSGFPVARYVNGVSE
ncbi:hypothetical protein HK096_005164 [Nowakowskiella sp. JEL0078]|nr:hypothetical protein HK096_005164 [Nowakowskiella sp. JEL0078]